MTATGELQRIAAALREAERERDAILRVFRLAGAGTFQTTFAGYVTAVDDAFCRLSGLTRPAALGEGWRDAVHPEDRAWLARVWARALAEQTPLVASFRFVRWDETTTVVRVVLSVFCNGEGWGGTVTPISGLVCPEELHARQCPLCR